MKFRYDFNTQHGYRPVIGYHGSIISLGSQRLLRGDVVSFKINDNLSTQKESLQRAFDITSPRGHPLLLQDGEYGRYLQSKMGLPMKQQLLPQYGDDGESGYDVEGFIANYNHQDHYGFIEIVAPQNLRYRRMLFHLKDALLRDRMMDYTKFQPVYTAQNKVIFTVVEIEDDEILPERIRKNEIFFTKKAINLVTAGKNYLDLAPIRGNEYEKYQKHKEMERTKREEEVRKQLFSTCSGCREWKHRSEFSDYQWNNMTIESRKCKKCINKFYKGWKWVGKLQGDAGAGWTAEALINASDDPEIIHRGRRSQSAGSSRN